MVDQRKLTIRSDRHVMPWVIAAVNEQPMKDCVLVASMDGNEMLSISLHVASDPAADQKYDS